MCLKVARVFFKVQPHPRAITVKEYAHEKVPSSCVRRKVPNVVKTQKLRCDKTKLLS